MHVLGTQMRAAIFVPGRSRAWLSREGRSKKTQSNTSAGSDLFLVLYTQYFLQRGKKLAFFPWSNERSRSRCLCRVQLAHKEVATHWPNLSMVCFDVRFTSKCPTVAAQSECKCGPDRPNAERERSTSFFPFLLSSSFYQEKLFRKFLGLLVRSWCTLSLVIRLLRDYGFNRNRFYHKI